ncbi:MAG: hypothetical protein HOE90_23255 [Bacteriovoracaceae bacterium]|jgi:hypothetical protein|nr:hypothetical protein [Bacteriovoracaceae bacterium]
MHKGSCLCGEISFEVSGDLPKPTACHCSQCRRHSGHYEASVDVLRSSVKMVMGSGLVHSLMRPW